MCHRNESYEKENRYIIYVSVFCILNVNFLRFECEIFMDLQSRVGLAEHRLQALQNEDVHPLTSL